MSKKRVNDWIAPACQALEKSGIACDGRIDSKFRGQIASFGAAVTMGSLKSAVAFFSQQGGAAVCREQLLPAMYCLVTGNCEEVAEPAEVFRYVCSHDDHDTRDKFIDAAIALKLAMNLFNMGKEDDTVEESEPVIQ